MDFSCWRYEKSQGQLVIYELHSLGALNGFSKFLGDPPNNCRDIWVWTKVGDHPTDRPTSPSLELHPSRRLIIKPSTYSDAFFFVVLQYKMASGCLFSKREKPQKISDFENTIHITAGSILCYVWPKSLNEYQVHFVLFRFKRQTLWKGWKGFNRLFVVVDPHHEIPRCIFFFWNHCSMTLLGTPRETSRPIQCFWAGIMFSALTGS